MRLLSFTIVGVILGFLAGIKFGEWASVEDAGFLAAFYVDGYVQYYSTWGALIGGAAGAIIAAFTADR